MLGKNDHQSVSLEFNKLNLIPYHWSWRPPNLQKYEPYKKNEDLSNLNECLLETFINITVNLPLFQIWKAQRVEWVLNLSRSHHVPFLDKDPLGVVLNGQQLQYTVNFLIQCNHREVLTKERNDKKNRGVTQSPWWSSLKHPSALHPSISVLK